MTVWTWLLITAAVVVAIPGLVAFVHYRTLFEKLLESAKADARSQEASA